MKLLTVFCIGIFISAVQSQKWTQLSGGLKQISVSQGIICGVNSDKTIFCATSGITLNPSWVTVPGPANAKQVAVYGRELALVTDDNKIMRAFYNGSSTTWSDMPGALKQVSIDGSQICGTNPSNGIYCTSYNRYSLCFPEQCNPSNVPSNSQFEPTYEWRGLQGGLKQLVVRAGRLFGANPSDGVFYGRSYTGNQGWVHLTGSLAHISYDYDYGRICGVNFEKKIFCATENIFTNPAWKLIDGGLDNLELWDNAIYGTINGYGIYYRSFQK